MSGLTHSYKTIEITGGETKGKVEDEVSEPKSVVKEIDVKG